ncbi:D-3-phosphoglycerate dehydrogenase [Colletotrichum shisoi]|uniref:D-3-phosphoglycerate dehydrogenase n=1 Tax=Colletotrichum shisoi TaxID=2078593 RepID=A0A5Q4BZI8_9PEZI|nr:D-3-phosphoglycerate dehydrogenase [Colletotrichum shisoi]
MAPSRIDSPVKAVSETTVTLQKKPTMHLLERFPEEAVKYCQAHFHTILPVDEEVANWLRAIGKQGTDVDIIDKDAADARGIAICNTPGQEAGNEVRKEHCMGMTLSGKSIGILGMGAIGTAVATMFRGAFGARVWVYDPFAPAKAWSDIEHTRVQNFEEMLPHVDVLTLHIPLNSQTQGLIGAKQLTAMKAGSILINVARGGIVDEPALIRVLNEGHLFGAGLDCHEEEPLTLEKHQALWETGRVVSTPHIGVTTKETVVKTATSAIDSVLRHLSSTPAVS